MKSPKIQLFNAVFNKSLSLEYDTYDYLPGKDEEVSYPFVYVAGSIGSDVINNKEVITGNISQTIHVWEMANNRAHFAEMIYNLEMALRRLTKLDNYYVRLVSLDSNEIFDNTTTDNLLHGVIQAEYRIT
ncbi:hypothetical protein F0342_21630 [Bacillus sp. CH30_1T]|uniref:hypothetical protein n=1 Tax=Bacillus sp. CH30_1T TaxID=2604836 RepID=UPI0011EECE6C|nr:hypothetical protein [Bacillus sp. CH30_1T]KAA0560765.1 hypothetical protein F0342_21630 [Bacillus sp. CH30_1T]